MRVMKIVENTIKTVVNEDNRIISHEYSIVEEYK